MGKKTISALQLKKSFVKAMINASNITLEQSAHHDKKKHLIAIILIGPDKLFFQRKILIIFKIINLNIYCGCSIEPSH